jgi:methyl coenzyme M reductase subunit C-like uncharacterized protein (methanogenesis marker protein 7)
MANAKNAEINYIVPDASSRQADYEDIFAAMGAYEDQTERRDFRIQQTAEINSDDKTGSVSLRLVRDIREGSGDDPITLAKEMREGVESQFSAEDHARFSGYFTEIAMPKMPPLEK